MTIRCCMNCEERHVSCHANCERYLNEKREIEAENQNKRQADSSYYHYSRGLWNRIIHRKHRRHEGGF